MIMKQCPSCQTTYADDTLRFCLQDGTPLVSVNSETELPTAAFTDSETLVSPRRVEPLNIPLENTQTRDWEPSQQTKIAAFEPSPKKSNTFLIVALTAFVMLLIFGGAVGGWIYLKNRRTEVVQNNNNKAVINQNPLPKNNANAETSPSPTATPTATKTPTPSPTVTPTPPPNVNPEQLKREISERIGAWQSAAESLNVNAYMNNYADTVDYYNKNGASLNFVRQDKQRFFNKFNNIEINISNLRVTPDASGDSATAVFDKEWAFDNGENASTGKVQTQLRFKKFDGKWLITGEKDLKVYYTE